MDSLADDTCLRCNETEGLNSRVLIREGRVVGLVRFCDEHDINDGEKHSFSVTLEVKSQP